ncbi:MAG: hypothetical protein ACYS19_13260, partial [Planctomycetota bacterium]
MKKLIKICSLALIAWLLTVGVAQALPFGYDMEGIYEGVTGTPWETSFPYQRNIYWDFESATPHYEGYDDDQLKSSDWWDVYGDVTWDPSSGKIGIPFGATNRYGYAVFHIDNWDRPWDEKHIWFDLEITGSGTYLPGVWGPAGLEGASSSADAGASLDGWAVFPFEPNPPWEEI